MSIKKYSGNAWTDISQIKKYSGGAWNECESAKKYQNGAWTDVWNKKQYIIKDGKLQTSFMGGDIAIHSGTGGSAASIIVETGLNSKMYMGENGDYYSFLSDHSMTTINDCMRTRAMVIRCKPDGTLFKNIHIQGYIMGFEVCMVTRNTRYEYDSGDYYYAFNSTTGTIGTYNVRTYVDTDYSLATLDFSNGEYLLVILQVCLRKSVDIMNMYLS